ncbi:MAG: hypothetical protein EBX52_06220, partial [Proteobacteria bacterium]|nr:hypothetical protein [Pseudomonadota bacterium]
FSPAGLVEIDGSLYISDFRNHVIYSYTTSDGTLNLFAGSWNPGAASTSPVLLTSASFNVPRGLSGFLENNSPRILVADTGNQAIRLIGTPNSPKSKVSTLIPGAPNLVSPYMAVKGKDGYFYIADAGDNHIKRVTPFTNRLTVISGENSTPGSSDGIGSLNTSHSQPKALGVLPGGDLLVMDQGTSNNGGIRKIARLPACPNENSVNGQMHLLQNESCAMAFTVLGSGNELNSGTDTVVADLEIRSDNPNSNSMTTARYQQALASETFYNSTTNVASFSLNNQWNDLTPLLISLYLGFTPPAGAPDPLLLQARIQTLDGQWDSNPKSHLTFSGTGFIVDRLVKTQPVTFIEVVFLVQSPTSGPTILRRTYNLSPFPQ